MGMNTGYGYNPANMSGPFPAHQPSFPHQQTPFQSNNPQQVMET